MAHHDSMQGGTRVRRLGEVLAAIAVPAAAAAYLHRLGDHPRFGVGTSDLDLWLQVTPLEDVTAGLLRLAGLAAAYWLLGSTVLYLAARATRIPAAVRAVEWMTLPVARRAADRAVALLLAGTALAAGPAPALATHQPVWPSPLQHTDTGTLPAADGLGIPPQPPAPVPTLAPKEGVAPIGEEPPALPGEPDRGTQSPVSEGGEAASVEGSPDVEASRDTEGDAGLAPPAAGVTPMGELRGDPPDEPAIGQQSPTPEGGEGASAEVSPDVRPSLDTDGGPSQSPPREGAHPMERRGGLPEEPGVEVDRQESSTPGGGKAAPAEPTPDIEASKGEPTPEPRDDNAEARRYEVVAGDNLWVIAERALAQACDRGPSDAEVARYWRSVIDTNTPRLRSGDPDLIYPGELLELPTVPTPEEASGG